MKNNIIKRSFHWLHLWLGLASGIVVCIVSITGCIYAFKPEITDWLEPYRFVAPMNKPFLSPLELRNKVVSTTFTAKADSSNVIYDVTYNGKERAAIVTYGNAHKKEIELMINPYDGKVLHKQNRHDDFFSFILRGHRSLWLPKPIGHYVVGWSIFLFFIVSLTGLFLWIPKKWNKKTLKSILTIKQHSGVNKKIYDLHKVLGFYTLLFALCLCTTGLTWSFDWFSKAYYGLLSGGGQLEKWEVATSDSTQINKTKDLADVLWNKVIKEYPLNGKGSFTFMFPIDKSGSFGIAYNPEENSYRKREYRFFNQYSLKELKGGGIYGTPYRSAPIGDKIYRMNYDIHSGAIAGLPGRILMFFACFIIATLPITGFLIWKRRRIVKKK